MSMYRVIASIQVCAAMLSAQTVFEKAPPGVEDALRDRVQKFYRCFVERKFRDAQQYVAVDSQDVFFEMEKPHYLDFSIGRVNFSDNYTKASVSVVVKAFFNFQGQSLPEEAPITTAWKVENGGWFWYIPQSTTKDTPFGPVKIDPRAKAQQGLPATPDFGVVRSQVMGAVSLDTKEIKLKSQSDSFADVHVKNTGKAPVTITIAGVVPPGLTVDPVAAKLGGGETTRLRIEWSPPALAQSGTAAVPSATLILKVSPTEQTLPVRILFE